MASRSVQPGFALRRQLFTGELTLPLQLLAGGWDQRLLSFVPLWDLGCSASQSDGTRHPYPPSAMIAMVSVTPRATIANPALHPPNPE